MGYVEVENIVKSYGKKRVLEDVSFQIQKGDRFGMIGPNGAGKSTLIDIITGLREADGGTVRIDGLEIQKDTIEARKRIGLVPQDLALMEELNARDNLEYFGTLYGLHGQKLKERIEEALELVGLTDHAKGKVKKYSGGMKRRLNIACAILHRPEFLILDEPTVGVDPQSRNHIFEFLKKLGEEGTTILYTSHYMEEVEALCNKIFLIDLGKEVAYGSIDTVKQMVATGSQIVVEADMIAAEVAAKAKAQILGILNYDLDTSKLTLQVDDHFQLMDLIGFLENQKVYIKSINRDEVSLEQAFLQLTGKNLRD